VLAPGLFAAEWSDNHLFRNIHSGSVESVCCISIGFVTMGIVFGLLTMLIGLGIGKRS
jgi:hypothetical protein